MSAQKLLPILSGRQGVVPLGMDIVFLDGQCLHLSVRNLLSDAVGSTYEVRSYPKPGQRRGGAQMVENGFVAVERSTRPVLAHLTE